MEGKEVYIKGHMLVMDRKENIYILSKNPYSSCYFCGSAGPETIIELHLKPGHARIKNDEVITIKGILKLNKDDIYHCNYILKNAEVFEE